MRKSNFATDMLKESCTIDEVYAIAFGALMGICSAHIYDANNHEWFVNEFTQISQGVSGALERIFAEKPTEPRTPLLRFMKLPVVASPRPDDGSVADQD